MGHLVDKSDIDKLAHVRVDLNKLSNVVKNEVIKKSEHKAKIKNIEDKMPDSTNLATKTILNTKINEVKTEIPSISGLATTSTLTTVENKIPNVHVQIHDKYITTPEFKMLTTENFAARLAQANLVTKTYFDDKQKNLNKKLLQIKQIIQ